MAASIVAAGICLAFTYVDRLKRVSGAGFTAELQEKIEETAATVEQLRLLGVALATPIVGMLAGGNRWGGLGNLKFELHDEVNKYLHRLSVTEGQLAHVNKAWHYYFLWDHLHRVGSIARDHLETLKDNRTGNAFANEFNARYELGSTVNPEDVRKFVRQHVEITGELEEALVDLEHYQQTNKMRRPDVWKKNGD